MNLIPQQNPLLSWGNIIYNFQKTSFELNKFEEKLRINFTVEYEKIKSDNSSIDYFRNKEQLISDFVANIPEKLGKLQLLLRSYKDKCYSCIITDEEVDLLASFEHIRWMNYVYQDGWQYGEIIDAEAKTHPDLTNFPNLNKTRQRFYRELISTIPVILKLCGYEIYKPAEQSFIKDKLLEGIARAIHERFRMLMRDMNEKSKTDTIYEKLHIVNVYNRQYFLIDFDQLPDEIKSSNIDSAHHISTKLLSIGYLIKETERKSNQAMFSISDNEIETMAKLEHERWAWEKRLNGFTYGATRNDALKKHHCLIPYNDLPELEKEKDRLLVKFYPALLDDINYSVVALSPEQLQNISYFPRQRILLQESLENIERTISAINEEGFHVELEMKINLSNQLNESLKCIRSTTDEQYAASQIQQCILPTRLFFKSCLSDSFILYKPKDILSGDFYFISKIHNFIIMAAADCTGHGTAGAMLSMICSNYLDQAVNDSNLTDPSMIIAFVYKKLFNFMKRQNHDIISDYGMEIAICTIILDTRTVFYAGINRPLYLFRNEILEVLEPQKLRAGSGYEALLRNVQPSQQINMQMGDTIYVFSDGYVDQFGGEDNKKFLTRNFKDLLGKIQSKSMLEQYETLNSTIEQWKGSCKENAVEQTDDILVIGVRI